MESLSEQRRAVAAASPEDWPFRVTDLARDLEVELARPDVLLEIADKVLAVAQDYGCQAVVGASRVGSQIAGALVARAGNGLRLFSESDPVDRVLVIDAVLATGTQIARIIRTVKDAGAKQAMAAVVLGSHDALGLCREEVEGDVVALDEF